MSEIVEVLNENFICGRTSCGGKLVPVRTVSDKITEYECKACHVGTQFECLVCHNPRTIINDSGVCFLCVSKINDLVKFFAVLMFALKK